MTDLDLLVTRMKSTGAQRVFKVNAVPPTDTGNAYAVLGLDTGLANRRRVTGNASTDTHTLTVQCFSPSEAGVMDMARYADLAFNEQALTEFDDDPFCWRSLTVGPIRDPDVGGLLYVLHTYRY